MLAVDNQIEIKLNIEQVMISWEESGETHSAHWRSEAGVAAPRRVAIADDSTTADTAYRLACEGTALLWRGDFQNARQLLLAMARRADQKTRKAQRVTAGLKTKKLPKAAVGPAAAVSAYAGAEDRRSALLAGFQHHIAKPVDTGHLLAVIEQLDRESVDLLEISGGTYESPAMSDGGVRVGLPRDVATALAAQGRQPPSGGPPRRVAGSAARPPSPHRRATTAH